MIDQLNALREKFFLEVAKLVGTFDGQLIVLTHLLEDRPAFLSALQAVAPISLLIGIPYSIDNNILPQLEAQYPTITPTLAQLCDSDYLITQVSQHVNEKPIIILEIGGYFAPALEKLCAEFPNKIIGVIEDTEMGHRQYAKLASFPCPVISIARSVLKDPEDFLIGNSCLFSTEKILRQNGLPLQGKHSLVIGFGRVGHGLAHALQRQHCPVSVYDIDPIRRVIALSEGFHVPDKHEAIQDADIIYGATGNMALKGDDFKYLARGCILVSCSSRNVEFDLDYLQQHYQSKVYSNHLAMYYNDQQTIYLFAQGQPINFIDGAVVGPILSLVQAEIILAIRFLILAKSNVFFEIDLQAKKLLAEKWLRYFCCQQSGHYKLWIDQQQLNELDSMLPKNYETSALDMTGGTPTEFGS